VSRRYRIAAEVGGWPMSVQGKVTALVILILTVPAMFAQQSAQPSGAPALSGQNTSSVSTTSNPQVKGNLEVLSDTQGVDFGPYLGNVVSAVRKNWYTLIPETARPPVLKRGKVSIQFAILPNGKVTALQYSGSSGDIALDRAAWGGITASDPFAPLPQEFHGPSLALRFHFYYNPQKTNDPEQMSPVPPATTSADH
jgi:TonB family protein